MWEIIALWQIIAWILFIFTMTLSILNKEITTFDYLLYSLFLFYIYYIFYQIKI
jgi:hypothetical protein